MVKCVGVLLHAQNDFAELAAGFEVFVGEAAFGEGEGAIEDGPEFARGDEFEDRCEFGFVSHVRAEDGELAAEEEAEIDFGIEAGGGTAGDEAAAASEGGDAIVPGGGAYVFEDDVHAALGGEAADFVPDFLRVVVDEVVGPEFFGFGELGVVASCGDNAAAEKFCDLNAGRADTAACAENENGFGGLELRASEQHVPGGLENEWDGGSFFERKIFGVGEAVGFGTADEFGAPAVNHVAEVGKLRAVIVAAGEAGGALAAGDSRGEENFLAGPDRGDVGADFFDDAGDVAAGNVRKRDRNAGEAAAYPEVEMIEGAGVDAGKDFARAGFGFGDVGVVEDFGAAVVVEKDGFHLHAFGLRFTAAINPNRSIPAQQMKSPL